MKPHLHRRVARVAAAFTLADMLISMAVFMLVIGGVIASSLYGLRMHEVVKPKLSASDEARSAITRLMHEVRSANVVRLGTGSMTSFTEVEPDRPQVGNAIQLSATADTSRFIRYYWDSADRTLKRTADDSSVCFVVANCVSNQMVFTSEDYAGNVITNNQNNRVIGLTLQFYQIQYPVTRIGDGGYYDYYQIRTRITRRTLL